jgi:uncharacterized phage protein (TIGR02218 family)
MSYSLRETSAHEAQPIELYHFTQGAESWRYTSSEMEYLHNSALYQPITIKRTAPEISQERGASGITVTVPRDNKVAGLFRVFVPRSTIGLTIYRLHGGDDELVTFWQGRVRAVNWQGSEAQIACEPLTAMLQREGPRLVYQSQCNHMLYSQFCTVVSEQYKQIITVIGIGGNQITATELSAKPDDWYPTGFLSRDGLDFRMITEHRGDTVSILLPFEDLKVGDRLFAYAGCDRSIQTCQKKFDNHINFGGFPYIPTKNPFETGIE